MEMERIRFVLSSYLRCRLMKVCQGLPAAHPREELGGCSLEMLWGPTAGGQSEEGQTSFLGVTHIADPGTVLV